MRRSYPSFFDFNNPGVDVSKILLEFLIAVVGENSKTVRILKGKILQFFTNSCNLGCNQSVIAPTVYRLKSILVSHYPYKVSSTSKIPD